MQRSSNIIVGIDPGTTVAYAILDLDGNIIATNSKKELTLSNLITEVIKYGHPIISATDVTPIPSFVKKFSANTGAKTISPDEDLTKKEKQILVKQKSNNIHEFDALSAAFYAFKTLKPLITKIDNTVENKKLRTQIESLVIKSNITINTAIKISTKPEKETKIIKKVIEKRILLESDFIKHYEHLQNSKKDINLLKQQNQRLQQESISYKKKFNLMVNKLAKYIPRTKMDSHIHNKQREINSLKKQKQELELKIKKEKTKLQDLNNLILDSKNKVIVKKSLTQIKKGDIFLLDQIPTSPKIISELKNKVSILIYKKGKPNSNFTCINAKNLNIKEHEDLAFITNASLEKELNKQNILSKVVEEYQSERAL